MAHPHNVNPSQNKSLMRGIGDKVKKVAEIAGAVKGIFDTGKMIYQTVAPMIRPAVAAARLL